ncbi:MAG TPA: hypothetical protein VHG29_05585 [Novosphingobium sp.]|nr:hypothetical protein [Novosphingobium sp.]
MKRAIPLLALALTACAGGDRMDRRGLRPTANPSAVIAAELAFAQLAQDKGQWTAFRDTATSDAVMFVPQTIRAQDFLKGRANPPVAVKWQPHQIWSSCDGSIAVTRGAWQRPNGTGYFTTVWQRQRDGGYKWVLDQGEPLAMALDAPEMIAAKVAECKPRPAPSAALLPDRRTGQSDDGTLIWEARVDAQCGRTLRVALWDGTKLNDVFSATVEAPPAAERPAGGCS